MCDSYTWRVQEYLRGSLGRAGGHCKPRTSMACAGFGATRLCPAVSGVYIFWLGQLECVDESKMRLGVCVQERRSTGMAADAPGQTCI